MSSAGLSATLTGTQTLSATLTATAALTAVLTIPQAVSGGIYSGAYEVTPTDETQTLDTANRLMTQAVTINPIPSNYGLITWDGSTLTVS